MRHNVLGRKPSALDDQTTPSAVRVSIGDSNHSWDYHFEKLHDCQPARPAAQQTRDIEPALIRAERVTSITQLLATVDEGDPAVANSRWP